MRVCAFAFACVRVREHLVRLGPLQELARLALHLRRVIAAHLTPRRVHVRDRVRGSRLPKGKSSSGWKGGRRSERAQSPKVCLLIRRGFLANRAHRAV
eukprot:6199192-Pleurochrysis_carterae.AAC.3